MTINDIVSLFTDYQDVYILDLDTYEEIFVGESENIPSEVLDYEVKSINSIFKGKFDGYVGLNVSSRSR